MNTNVFTLDALIAIALIIISIIILFRMGYKSFVIAGQALSTFSTQYSIGVSISTIRVLSFAIAPLGLRRGNTGLKVFVPFMVYVIVLTVIASLTWEIPEGVSYFYGKGRMIVQLFNFAMFVLVARATVLVLVDRTSVENLWRFLMIAVMLHGAASLYQMIAASVGLPMIGISRPFGLTAEAGVGDVAAFHTHMGSKVVRAVGLGGEPKGVAGFYSVYIISFIYGGGSIFVSRREKIIAKASLILSVIGFLGAFSTSSIFGILAALILTALALEGWRSHKIIKIISLMPAILIIWMIILNISNLEDFNQIFRDRTTNRIGGSIGDSWDYPIAASIDAITKNPLILIFGDGLGGSSFLTMAYLGETFEYAYAPNVGFILFLVELGLIGTGLFLAPLILANIRLSRFTRRTHDLHVFFLVALSISSCVLFMAGAGLPFSLPLSVGASMAALRIIKNRK